MIPKTHIDTFSAQLKVFEAREADVEARRSAAAKAHHDRLEYLSDRAAARSSDYGELSDEHLQDIEKFLAFFGVKDVENAEEELDQAFVRAVYIEYHALWREGRDIKREMIEAKLVMETTTLQHYKDSITEREDLLLVDESECKSEDVRMKLVAAKALLRAYIADTEKEIRRIEHDVAMDKLLLMSFQKEGLN